MSLIKSISGIRGTIGGRPGEGLSPIDVVKFTTAFATFLKQQNPGKRLRLAVGRDARLSGPMVNRLVVGTLQGCGVDVLETGLSTTPTTEMTVIDGHCDGGIIITASHNPKHWNALKLLNAKGEFISDKEGKEVLRLAESPDLQYADVDDLGQVTVEEDWIDRHIERVLGLKLVDVEAIKKANFKVAVDAVNSTGGLAIPRLLRRLGVEQVVELNCEPTGHFAHNPEPIPQNLTQISDCVRENRCDLGIVVDPDVDRLALVCETGEMFGEEYTLVSVADYVLSHTPGNTVSNLSSSRALRDVTRRDALVGVALFLTLLAKKGMKVSELRKTYPEYIISKNRKDLTPDMDVDALLAKVAKLYNGMAGVEKVTTIDGVKIDFADGWVHLRKSNTEPIIRIYSEAHTMAEAEKLGNDVKAIVQSLC